VREEDRPEDDGAVPAGLRIVTDSLDRTRDLLATRLGRGIRYLPGRPRALRQDILAGLPGAISSVPDGMAASVLAGVNPAHGLYASFAGPVAGGLTSSTRLMVVTTTSAAALAAGSALAPYDGHDRSQAMLLLTLMAGGLMVLAAIVGLSRYIRFVSYSVMLGFLSGVACNMVLGQLADLVGVSAHGSVAVTKAWDVLTGLGAVDVPSTAAAAGALAILLILGRTRLTVFSSLVALAVPTVIVAVTGASSVARVSDTGAIPTGLPLPRIPDLGVLSPGLVGGAAAVAALVLVQGAGVAEAVPNSNGARSSARRDFTAQGVANLASGLMGGQPVGGSVGQTALNLTAGATSRWAGVFSGLWMAAILLVFSGLVGQVAMPTLAAVLVYAGIGALRPGEIVAVARAGHIPALAMGATFVAVLVLPVAQAVGVGLVASLLLQLRQEALDLRVVRLRTDDDGRLAESRAPQTVGPGDVVVLDVYGSLFFAGSRTLQRLLPLPSGGDEAGDERDADSPAGPVVVLRLRGRTTLGATFLQVAGGYAATLARVGGRLYLSGVDASLFASWDADGTLERLGDVHVEQATAVIGESTRLAVSDALRLTAGSRPTDGP
jgi:SulP family sulfate permease